MVQLKLGSELPSFAKKFQSVPKIWTKYRLNFREVEMLNLSYNISCGAPQSSVPGPLHFLAYINDLNKAYDVLNTVNLTNDANLFYFYQNVKTLLGTVNCELQKISEWFRANQL